MILMESPGNGLPLTEFPLHQTHHSFRHQTAPGVCNNNIYKVNDGGKTEALPDRQPLEKMNRLQEV